LTNVFSSAIHQGAGQSNSIAIVANGTHLELYVNGQQIKAVSDSTSTQGAFGVVVSSQTGPKVPDEVAFNDIQVWKI
jgi:hypothetical protein